MSTPTNFNQPNTPNFGTPDTNKSNGPMIGMGVAIALLLLAVIYLFVSKNSMRDSLTGQLTSTSANLSEKEQDLIKLNADFDAVKTQLEASQGDNQQLNAQIQEKIAQLDKQRNSIAGLIRENKSYKSEVAAFENQKNTFLTEIEGLKAQVGQLTTQNQTLNTSLTETQTRLQEEGVAKAALVSEKTALEVDNKVMSKKVDIASAVKVKNITTKAIDVRSNGKEKSKSKAKKVDKLNICFTTEANEVVPAGEETFYLRIVDPTGAPLAIESLGSGVSRDKKAESEFRYTTTATTNYTNGEAEVCGSWQPGQNFVKGKYNVEVYNKGYLVGTGAFNLK